MAFSVWNEKNECLSWADTVDICDMLKIQMVPVIAIMDYDEEFLKRLAHELDTNKDEGYVIRNYESFHYDDFSTNVGKWVRPKHVTSSKHWAYEKIIPNRLKT